MLAREWVTCARCVFARSSPGTVEVIKVVEVIEVIEARQRRSLDRLDILDALDHLCTLTSTPIAAPLRLPHVAATVLMFVAHSA